ncbi:hypothetical protein M0R45_027488 [Rubus argutus]|uniref:J domain-containing protein n=1 Tax=Rubus argutus TaxID=59490 RepID=A0AAW1X0J9_RUBAR
MNVEEDHYSALGLPSGEEGAKLTEKEITEAYRAKALELQRDKRPNSPHVHANFQRLDTAYGILKNESSRKVFDQRLRDQREKHRRHSELFSTDSYCNAKALAAVLCAKIMRDYLEIARMPATHSTTDLVPKKETSAVEKILKVSWEKLGGGGYTAEMLRDLLSKFGEVEDLVFIQEFSALVLMGTRDAAVAATRAVVGHHANPLVVALLPQKSDEPDHC